MRFVTIVVGLLILSGVAVIGFTKLNQRLQPELASTIVEQLAPAFDSSAFERADEVRPLNFPQDLGPHPTFQTEWWYYTGNLADDAGNRYGFQLTFFRRGLTPEVVERSSEWASSQIYFAHFAITDVTDNQFYPRERFSRGGAELAGAQSEPYRVWLDGWEARELEPGVVQLQASDGDIALDLTLEALKPATLQGDRGLSPKGPEPGQASYYYSLTRQAASGTIRIAEKTADVTGLVWKDHEWSTDSLAAEAEGWDWVSMQLDDGRDVTFGEVRAKDDGGTVITGGTISYADGTTRTFDQNAAQLTVLDYWQSPDSKTRYPAKWSIAIPSEEIDVVLTPLIPNQEIPGFITYWEGAVKIEGTQSGFGYVELTGYFDDIQGRF